MAAADRLPGWSRARVATHVARQADALGRLVVGIRTGEPVLVNGPANLLLGWLTGRYDGAELADADAVRLPSFG